jgi:hypothetical protein
MNVCGSVLLVLDGWTVVLAQVPIVRAVGAAGPSARLLDFRCSTLAA